MPVLLELQTTLKQENREEALQKELALSAPEMAIFKARFERVQRDLLELVRSVDRLPEDKRDGAWRGLHTLLDMAKSECEGKNGR